MDDSVASIGSANFDHRSLELNFESNAVIYDKDFAKKVKAAYLDDIEKWCTELTTEKYLERSWRSSSRRTSRDSTARSPKAIYSFSFNLRSFLLK